jgi:hypothetical protein
MRRDSSEFTNFMLKIICIKSNGYSFKGFV